MESAINHETFYDREEVVSAIIMIIQVEFRELATLERFCFRRIVKDHGSILYFTNRIKHPTPNHT